MGPRGLRRLVLSRTCCPISAKPRTTSGFADRYHGVGGPLGVSDPVEPARRSPRLSSARPSNRACPFNPDFNGEGQEGCGLYQVTCRDGRRRSAAARICIQEKRPNLTVRRMRWRARIMVENGRAVGVELVEGRERENASVSRGHRHGRRDQFAPAADALRYRPGGRVEGTRHQTRPRPEGRRAGTCRTTSTLRPSATERADQLRPAGALPQGDLWLVFVLCSTATDRWRRSSSKAEGSVHRPSAGSPDLQIHIAARQRGSRRRDAGSYGTAVTSTRPSSAQGASAR